MTHTSARLAWLSAAKPYTPSNVFMTAAVFAPLSGSGPCSAASAPSSAAPLAVFRLPTETPSGSAERSLRAWLHTPSTSTSRIPALSASLQTASAAAADASFATLGTRRDACNEERSQRRKGSSLRPGK